MDKEISNKVMREVVAEYFRRHDVQMQPLFALCIDGVEITQSIQYYHADEHLTDAADRGPDNSIRVVANKPTWVRVYLRSALLTYSDTATGSAVLERRVQGFAWRRIATLTPEPPGIANAVAFPDYVQQRSSTTRTLNFVIPAKHMLGHLRLRIEVASTGSKTYANGEVVYIDATLHQTMRVAGILVGYDGPNAVGTGNLTITEPGIGDLEATAAWMLNAYPVSEADFRVAGTVTLHDPLTDAPSCAGCCSPNWIGLNAEIQQVMVADGNQPGDLYYGLLARGIPIGPIAGCASHGVSSGGDGAQVIMAHEIGHVMGFGHAPCGGVGSSANPNYPDYEPYPSASIGEYGLNIDTGDVYPPASHRDYMSYCAPQWISLYHYKRLINHDLMHPEIRGEDSPWWPEWMRIDPMVLHHEIFPKMPGKPDPIDWRRMRMRPEKLISIIGVVRDGEVLEVTHVSRVESFRHLRDAKPTPMSAELIGDQGERLATAPVYRLPHQSTSRLSGLPIEDDPDTYVVQVMMKDVADGKVLRIVRDQEELWSRKAPKTRPKIRNLKVSVNREGRLTAKCDVEHAVKRDPDLWIRWSEDKGVTWHPLRIGLRGKRHTIDLSPVPAGRVQIQVLVHDGFFTTASEPVSVRVPKRPQTVSILHPQSGEALVEGRRLRLLARIGESSGRAVKPTRCQWKLDGRTIADELDAAIPAPKAGKHELTLITRVGRTKVERTVAFETLSIDGD